MRSIVRPLRLACLGAVAAALTAFLAVAPAAASPGPAGQSSGTATSASQPCGTMTGPPAHFDHVMWIFMENNPYDKLIGSSADPYTNQIADECGLATNYHNLTHPSAPEYLGATSGFLGGAGDCTPLQCPDTHNNIFNQLMQTGQTWKAYMESMHGTCFDPATASDPGLNTVGSYDSLHNPPLYYTDLQTVPSGGTASPCQQFDVPMGSPAQGNFANDLATNLPTFSFVTPNKCHDEHNCSIQAGDAYLKTLLPVIFNSQYYQQGELLVVLTWDEGEDGVSNNCAYNTTDIGCHVPAIVMSPYTPAGARSSVLFNHYSLLKTTEQLLNLPLLGHANDSTVTSMKKAFGL